MYYSESGEELKKFNTRDGKGFELLKHKGIKVGIITSEETSIVERRAKKMKLDFLFQGLAHKGKLDIALEICKNEGISIEEIAYIGDDLNCIELLERVGLAACPSDSVLSVKNISNINVMTKKGGEGAVREFSEIILEGHI
jgi:N-acylneuraminate cytidylyltransferase